MDACPSPRLSLTWSCGQRPAHQSFTNGGERLKSTFPPKVPGTICSWNLSTSGSSGSLLSVSSLQIDDYESHTHDGAGHLIWTAAFFYFFFCQSVTQIMVVLSAFWIDKIYNVLIFMMPSEVTAATCLHGNCSKIIWFMTQNEKKSSFFMLSD